LWDEGNPSAEKTKWLGKRQKGKRWLIANNGVSANCKKRKEALGEGLLSLKKSGTKNRPKKKVKGSLTKQRKIEKVQEITTLY